MVPENEKEHHFPNLHLWGSMLVLKCVSMCDLLIGEPSHSPTPIRLSSLSFGVRPEEVPN